MKTKVVVFAAALFAAVSGGVAHAAEQRLGMVFFTEWSALPDPAASQVVQGAKSRIDGMGGGTVVVTGYADTTGSGEANDLLSRLRAQVVIDQLVANSLPAGQIRQADRGATQDIGGFNESRRVIISVASD